MISFATTASSLSVYEVVFVQSYFKTSRESADRSRLSLIFLAKLCWRVASHFLYTCVGANPREELGATQHNAQTSNRRFRDDEFHLPRDLTVGRSGIRVRVKFTPLNLPLFPSRPLDEQAWSEIRYDGWCWVR